MGVLGGKLKFKEKLSARLGDVLSYLYIASAMLKRYEDNGRPEADRPLLAWAFQLPEQVWQLVPERRRSLPHPEWPRWC